MRKSNHWILVSVAVLLSATILWSVAGEKPERTGAVYIVRMQGDPISTYKGELPGLARTRPRPGAGIDARSTRVHKYRRHLGKRQEKTLRAAGIDPGSRLYEYSFSFNGFAARLSASELAALRQRPEVMSITPDRVVRLDTDNTPDFLGLTDRNGGLHADLGFTGEDVIIGVLDTGIWPEHPSFAKSPGEPGYNALPQRWNGICQAGEDWKNKHCNKKIIGARYFVDGYREQFDLADDEFLSARDADGHGTHTSSTAAGSAGVEAEILGLPLGPVSGMAPRARIAVYKVCWTGPQTSGSCTFSDLMAGIDAAVADGVDVINYSIGGGGSDPFEPPEIAFLNANAAGVFVAASAGNEGPSAGTVGHQNPWTTTIGASTHDRTFVGGVRLGNGSEHSGTTISFGLDTHPLVDGAAAGSGLCVPGGLDPAVVSGAIVLCSRGGVSRLVKSRAVLIAGGAGMILYNEIDDTQSLFVENHHVPTTHVHHSVGLAIRDYIDTAGTEASATLGAGAFTRVDAPWMARFSSRGPAGQGSSPDFLKPDITAPGVVVLAGNTPEPSELTGAGVRGQLFQIISGTSMSSPHVAGAAALIREAHPDWSPDMIKSALMTTAYQQVLKEDGVTPATPFDMGAGHLNPNAAVDPGLVFHAGTQQYVGFLCGVDPARVALVDPTICDDLAALGVSFDPAQVNVPSLAASDFVVPRSFQRTVTNVDDRPATYAVEIEGLEGYDVDVNPESIDLSGGGSASYTVSVRPTEQTEFGEASFGALTWSDGRHHVRTPVAVQATELAAPDRLFGAGVDGSAQYEVVAALDTEMSSTAVGLIGPDETTSVIQDDPTNDVLQALASGVGLDIQVVVVPPGTRHLRASLFDDATDGDDNLDLYLAVPPTQSNPVPQPIDASVGPGSNEEVNITIPSGVIPPTGLVLIVAVHAFETDGPDAEYTLFTWTPGSDEGNVSIDAPGELQGGTPATVELDWTGLEDDTRYLGGVVHELASGTDRFVLLDVRTDGSLVPATVADLARRQKTLDPRWPVTSRSQLESGGR